MTPVSTASTVLPVWIKGVVFSFLFALLFSISASSFSQTQTGNTTDPARPPSLKTIPIPEPDNIGDFIKDKSAAIVLGKALFWDMQVGSDGKTACATCHFNAGSDSRSKNQINPGHNNRDLQGNLSPDLHFDFGPNHQLTADDFPFRRLANPDDRASVAIFDSNDTVSSQGVFSFDFEHVLPGIPVDVMRATPDTRGFRIGETNVRRVAPRNAPSVINAIFNYRSLLDGRAQHEFNGINNWGARDPDAHVYRADHSGRIRPARILLNNASLASQAVAAPLSTLEMSAAGRSFPMIGRKLLSARPLALQMVHPQDSVLGSQSRRYQPGLRVKDYASLIRKAFHPQWWQSRDIIRIEKDGGTRIPDRPPKGKQWFHKNRFSLMEYNFSLYFGLAIQSYLATLVADDTPYDRFMEGDTTAISEAAIRGVDIFRSQTRGRCINCHEGAELTGASVSRSWFQQHRGTAEP